MRHEMELATAVKDVLPLVINAVDTWDHKTSRHSIQSPLVRRCTTGKRLRNGIAVSA
jgi:hypothetical protein